MLIYRERERAHSGRISDVIPKGSPSWGAAWAALINSTAKLIREISPRTSLSALIRSSAWRIAWCLSNTSLRPTLTMSCECANKSLYKQKVCINVSEPKCQQPKPRVWRYVFGYQKTADCVLVLFGWLHFRSSLSMTLFCFLIIASFVSLFVTLSVSLCHMPDTTTHMLL